MRKKKKSKKPVVAAFDFDGTITQGDSLFPFLVVSAGVFRTLWRLFRESPILIGYCLGCVSRQCVKEQLLTRFFAGKPYEEVCRKGELFAAQYLPKFIKTYMLEGIAWHQEQGHRLILVSASLDIYLQPWAERAGFSDVLASRLEVIDGKVTGKLKGRNCRAAEKVRRLEALLGDKETYELYAYGDSAGDREMLAYADHPFYRMTQKGTADRLPD